MKPLIVVLGFVLLAQYPSWDSRRDPNSYQRPAIPDDGRKSTLGDPSPRLYPQQPTLGDPRPYRRTDPSCTGMLCN